MKSTLKDLTQPFLLLIAVNICAVFSLPILPIDETRYLSVAWEMWNEHSFLVPFLNGIAYAHKPPLLFWLMHAGWSVFGVNSVTPRLTILLFSLMSVVLVYLTSLRLWPSNKKAATFSSLLFASTFVWAAWSCVIMFDVVLTFWILLGTLGVLLAADGRRSGWVLLIVGLAGGLLTKGPAVWVYLVPLSLVAPRWRTRSAGKWVGMVLFSIFIGLLIALLWVVPAVIAGGEEYRHAILWGQTAKRMVSSFAHRRPIWWYLPILPVLFLPWVLFRPIYASLRAQKSDSSVRFCLAWIALPFLAFSLISGKQVHYLIPLIPAGVLLAGHNLSKCKDDTRRVRARLIGGVYILSGLIGFVLPFISMGGDVGTLPAGSTRIVSIGLMAAGLWLLIHRFNSVMSAVRTIAAATALVICLAFLHVRTGILKSYEITPVAQRIQQELSTGRPVAHVGKYHGQYQFLGRLTQALPVISQAQIGAFSAKNPAALFVSYIRDDTSSLPDNAIIHYSQRYRGKTVILWDIPEESN